MDEVPLVYNTTRNQGSCCAIKSCWANFIAHEVSWAYLDCLTKVVGLQPRRVESQRLRMEGCRPTLRVLGGLLYS